MILLYDQELRPLGPVRAVRWGYEQPENELTTATIELPCGDEMCQRIVVPASWARLYDGDEDLGYFRFSAITAQEHAPGGTVTYQLQSAQCTLLDGMLPGWHEIGGTDFNTRQVIEYILGMQAEKRWVLGECEFEDNYQYNFEDVTQLEALMSLGEVLLEDYQFVFDSTVTPWTMHLRRAETQATCSLIYRRNMTAIRRTVDGRVVTRLYGRGYGEGDNQLTIASVNGGLEYIDAPADVMTKWGIREGVHVDTRQTDAATLKARMEQILRAGQNPAVSYEAEAIDLYQATGRSWDRVSVGARVLVLDEMLGAPVTARVTRRKKDDVEGDPGAISYTLDTSRPDTAEELSEILDKIGVHELYSQGATNMYSMQIADNADASHPLVMRFYVPGNVLRINSCLIYWELDPFRTYVTLAKSGGSSRETSESGGGATVSLPQEIVTTTAATGGPVNSEEGSVNPTTEANETGLTTEEAGLHVHAGGSHRHYMDGHTHNLNAHTHSVSSGDSKTGTPSPAATVSNGSGYTDYSGTEITGQDGAHAHAIPPHTHQFNHWHHVTATVTIPPMVFELTAHSHTVTIPSHTHDLEYGVYESGRAQSVGLTVDGEAVPAQDIGDVRELDVAKYLRKDDDGRVVRGTWHEVAFTPDALTRITADLFFQVFIQSRGGGDY